MPDFAVDEVLADEIIARLNKLIENDDVRSVVGKLIEKRVMCSRALLDHPTLQVVSNTFNAMASVGFLGVLNGLIGIDPQLVGARKGWGFITAVFDDDEKLVNFERVKNKEQAQS